MKEATQIGVLAGGSHLTCLGVPLRSEDGSITLIPLNETDGEFLCLNGPFPREDSYWIELEKLARDYKLFIWWRGNQHIADYMFASDPLFDFVLSDQIDLPIMKDSVIVPEQMLREKFAPTFDRLEALLKNVAQRAHRGVFVCGTPPPKGDTAFIRATLAKEPYFVERLATLGRSAETVPLTAPETLQKLWRLIQNMSRDVAHRHGAKFIPIPAESQTPEGFLRKEFWFDITHANANLGRLFLRCLREHLQEASNASVQNFA
jgi:hypothetical protein